MILSCHGFLLYDISYSFGYAFCLDIEKMVSLKGMIIRCSSIIPEIREAVFKCLLCDYYSDPVVVDRGNYFDWSLEFGFTV